MNALNGSQPRSEVLAAIAGLLLALAPSAAGAGAESTVVTATLTDLADPGADDLWQVDYALAQPFAHGLGAAITVSLPAGSGVDAQNLVPSGCGWSGAFLFGDLALLAEPGLDQLAVDEVCPGGVPDSNLGGLIFIWRGAAPAPDETHRVVVYDPGFAVLETNTVAVPEPGPAAGGGIALAALLGAWALSRRRGARIARVRVASAALWIAAIALAPEALANEPVPGQVSYVFPVAGYEVTLEPTAFQRIGRFSFRYTFDASVRNTGAPTTDAVLSVGISQDRASFSDGLRPLPPMATNETIALGPIEMINQRPHFDAATGTFGGSPLAVDAGGVPILELCVMPVPVPGPSLPESDPAVALLDEFTTTCAAPDFQDPDWRRTLDQPPKVEFTVGRSYSWSLVTNLGTLRFALLPDTAPQHVAALIYLSRLGFFDGLDFHRVIQGFVAQGGDPLGNGTGGPGYRLAGEFDGAVQHDARGTLSTAHSGPVSDGSQFFVTFAATPFLDGVHTIAGRLIEGATVLDAIETLAAPPGCVDCAPSSPITITSSSIIVE